MRRSWLAASIAALALTALPSNSLASRPNFVHVLTDDQTIDSVRYMPKLAKSVAGHGTVFERHHATTSLCCPSRASFLTGQYTHNHGVIHNNPPYGFPALDWKHTLYTAMQNGGYRTGWIGKTLNALGTEAVKPQPGFDTWFVPLTTNDMFNWEISDDGKKRRIEGKHQNRVYLRRALSFLRERDRRPFLLTVSYFTPHWTDCPSEASDAWGRMQCPPEPMGRDRGAFTGKRFPAGPDFVGNAHERLLADTWWRRELESLQSVDRGIGRLIRELRRENELADTYFIFQSDNGFLHGEHGSHYDKHQPWERSGRVPLIIRGPGFEPRGHGKAAHRRDLTANVDVPATILDAAGVAPPVAQDGHSLLSPHRRKVLLLERLAGPTRFAQIKTAGGWTYWEGEGPWQEPHMFNLDSDPWEIQNLAASNPARAAQLATALDRIRDCAAPCP